MKKYTCLVALLTAIACSQRDKTQEKAMANAAWEEAMIAKTIKELRLASFYIPDANDPSTNETGITKESAQAFINKSQFYQNGKLKAMPATTFSQQYRAFLKTNQSNPYLRRFRRETAEEIMGSGQSLAVQEQALFTQELVATRSDEVDLMTKSIVSLRGKIPVAQEEQLTNQAKELLTQYEKSFADDLEKTEQKKGTTYRQRMTLAIAAEFARQGQELARTNRRLLNQVSGQ